MTKFLANIFDRHIYPPKNIACPDEVTTGKLKGFIEDFYTYDFTGFIHEEASDNEMDIEIDNGNVEFYETEE